MDRTEAAVMISTWRRTPLFGHVEHISSVPNRGTGQTEESAHLGLLSTSTRTQKEEGLHTCVDTQVQAEHRLEWCCSSRGRKPKEARGERKESVERSGGAALKGISVPPKRTPMTLWTAEGRTVRTSASGRVSFLIFQVLTKTQSEQEGSAASKVEKQRHLMLDNSKQQ